MEGTWSQYSISLVGMLCVYIVLFIYILCCFVYILFIVKILDFNGLVFKCCFFVLNRLLNVVDRVLNDTVR